MTDIRHIKSAELRPCETQAGDEGSAGGHDLPALAEAMRRESRDLGKTRNTRTLVAEPALRVTLVTLDAHSEMYEYSPVSPATLEVLHGNLRVHRPGGAVDLPAGHLLTISAAVPHAIEPNTDCVFLLATSGPQEEPTKAPWPTDYQGEPW